MRTVSFCLTLLICLALPAIPQTGSRDAKLPLVAVVVGIDHYNPNSGLPDLKWAQNDAAQMAAALRKLHYDATTIAEKDATASEILRVIGEQGKLLTPVRGSDKQGTFLFYFSGHGTSESGSNYLVTANAGRERLAREALGIDEIQRKLAGTPTLRKVLLLDACRIAIKAEGTRNRDDVPEKFAEFKAAEGESILLAAPFGESSREFDDLRHGAFTYFLLQALTSKPAIGFRELADSVSIETRKFTNQRGATQVPTELTAATYDFIVGGEPVNPAPAPPAPDRFDLTGCLLQKGGAVVLVDLGGTQVFELRSAKSFRFEPSLIGGQVRLVGTIDPSGVPGRGSGAQRVAVFGGIQRTQKGGCADLATRAGATAVVAGAAVAIPVVADNTLAGIAVANAAAAGVGLPGAIINGVAWAAAGDVVQTDVATELVKADKDYKFAAAEWAAVSGVTVESLLNMDVKRALKEIDDIKSKRKKMDEARITLRRAMELELDRITRLLNGAARSPGGESLTAAADVLAVLFHAKADDLAAAIDQGQKSPKPNRQLLDLLELQREKALNSQKEAQDLSRRFAGNDTDSQRNNTLIELRKLSQDAIAALATPIDVGQRDSELWQGFYTSWEEVIVRSKRGADPINRAVGFIGTWSRDPGSVCRDSSGRDHDLQLKFAQVEADGKKGVRGTVTISAGGAVGVNPVTLEFPVELLSPQGALTTYKLRIAGQTRDLGQGNIQASVVASSLLVFGLDLDLYGFPHGVRPGCGNVVFARSR